MPAPTVANRPHTPQAEVEAWLAEAEAVLEHDPARALALAHRVLEVSLGATKTRAWLLIGKTAYKQGRSAEALDSLVEAYAVLSVEHARDTQGALECALMLGRTCRDLGRFGDATSWLEEALALARKTASPLEAEALNLLAGVMVELGEYGRALEHLANALPIARDHKLQEREANILDYVGFLQSLLGNYSDALKSLKQAYDLLQKIAPGTRSTVANLVNLGNLYQDIGDRDQALHFLQRAREASRVAEDLTVEAAVLNNLANVHSDGEMWEVAQSFFEEALALSRRINHKAYEIDNLDGLGQVQVALGRLEHAVETHTAALAIAREIGERGGEVDALLNLGRDYLELGKPDDARRVLSEGLALAEKLGRLKSVFEAHEALSRALEAGGDLAGALRHQREFHRAEKAVFNLESEEKTRKLTVQFEVERARHEAEAYRLRTDIAQRARDEAEAMVLERTRELEEAQLEVVTRLALAAEYRDDVTGEHTRRVGRNAAAIAYALGWPEDEVQLLFTAARLHDVGKIGVSDAILLKPGGLSEAEFGLMRNHTVMGARILSDGRSRLLKMAEEIARAHHERWDGAGYPLGLSGESIPEAARVVAVADVLDALTHARPYKRAWPLEEALAEIARGRGAHFDPEVVDACVALFASKLSPLDAPHEWQDTLAELRALLPAR